MPGEENQLLWRGMRPVAGIRGVWPAIDSERIHTHSVRVVSGSIIVYTVPAGKKAFISNYALSVTNKVIQSGYGYMYVRNGASVFQYEFMIQYHEIVGAYVTTESFIPALEMSAGWEVILIQSENDMLTRGYVKGWLEDP